MKIFTDGGARGNPGPAASAFVVYVGEKIVYEATKFIGEKTNNFAEYTALIMALSWLLDNYEKFDTENIDLFMDSELVTKQMQGVYKIKNKNLIDLAAYAKDLQAKLKGKINYRFVPREKNKRADFLVNIAIDENSSKFHVHE